MAKDKLKGLTIEIGGDTSDLSDALKSPNKEASDLQSKLKAVEDALKLEPTNIDILDQKFRLLGKSIDANESKLELLKAAQKKFVDEGKDIDSNEYIELQKQIAQTTSKIEKLKNSQIDVANSFNKMDSAASSVNKVEKEVKQLEDAMDDAEQSSFSLGDALKGAFIGSGIVEGIEAIYGTISDTVEESKEYIKIMASLETSSKDAGYTAEETKDAYNSLYEVLGDDQSTATTVANLQAIGLSQENLMSLLNGTIGAWAKYGDSIPIDGLAEAVNETIKVGQVTGTFADVLNWAGVSEDEFNNKLANMSSETERANAVLDLFASQGLTESADAWRENAKELVESNNATAKMQKVTSKLSKVMLPFLSKMKGGFADSLLGITDLLDGSKSFDEFCDDIIDSFDDILPDIVKKGEDLLENLGEGISDSLPDLFSTLLDVVQSSGDYISDIAPELIDSGFKLLSNLVKGITDSLPVMIQKLPVIITTFANVINNNFPTILKKGADILWQLITGIIGAIPTLVANLPKIFEAFSSSLMAFNWLNLGKNIITFLGNGIKNMTSWIGSKASEIGTSILNKIKGINLYDIGSNLIKGLWNGINSVKNWILNKISGFTSSILKGIKDFFGIHSPSKVMADEVGKYLPAGIGEGILSNMDLALSPLEKLKREMTTSFDPNVSATVNKTLNANTTIVVESPIELNLDGKVIYANVVRRITHANSSQLAFQGV